MTDPEPLVTVQIAPGRWQKMTRATAAAKGYDVDDDDEPEAKTRTPANKARKAPAKKSTPRKATGGQSRRARS